jgi:hypothetical protein
MTLGNSTSTALRWMTCCAHEEFRSFPVPADLRAITGHYPRVSRYLVGLLIQLPACHPSALYNGRCAAMTIFAGIITRASTLAAIA